MKQQIEQTYIFIAHENNTWEWDDKTTKPKKNPEVLEYFSILSIVSILHKSFYSSYFKSLG